MKEQFDLSSEQAVNINLWDNGNRILNFFPNLPGIKVMIQDWVIQENHLWLVTEDIPISIFESLLNKDTVPFSSSYYTYEQLRRNFYNNNPQLW